MPAFTCKLYAYNTSKGNSKLNVSGHKYTVIFPVVISAKNMLIKLLRVKLRQMYEGNPVEIDSGSS